MEVMDHYKGKIILRGPSKNRKSMTDCAFTLKVMRVHGTLITLGKCCLIHLNITRKSYDK